MATKNPQIKATERTVLGRKVKKIRKEGIVPANLYGREVKSQNLQIIAKDFSQIYRQTKGVGILDLTIDADKKTRPVIIQNVQKDPVTNSILHVDFRQVDLTKKITAQVPVEMLGEAPGVATGGVLVQLLNQVEVESLPADLPDKLTINISGLNQIGESLTVSDLIYDKQKVSLKVEDEKMLVVKLDAPTKEEEVKPAVPAEGEAVAEGEAKPEEDKTAEAKPEAGKEGSKPTEKDSTTKPEEKKEVKK